MKLFKIVFFVFLFLLKCNESYCQIKLSLDSEVSILTISPGNSLNDAFGHNGIRIKDLQNRIDLVFDYGRYDFNKKGFYLNFVIGKLNYEIGLLDYISFVENYKLEKRSIYEQNIILNETQKQKLFKKLVLKFNSNEKTYQYDFFYNNCATKIRDDLKEISDNDILFSNNNVKNLTFRNLIRSHIKTNSWSGVGIDLVLGSVVDKSATLEEHMFLPKHLKEILSESKLKSTSEKLVYKTINNENGEIKKKSYFLFSPISIVSFLSLIILLVTFKDLKNSSRNKLLDLLIFLVTGFLGILIIFLWFGTNHRATAFNYNFLWAFCLNILMIKNLTKSNPNKKFISYIKFLIILILLMIIHWITGVQSFNYTLSPLVIALLFRYIYLVFYFKLKHNNTT